VIEVHSEIHYVPQGEGWEEVVVRNVLHYVPIAAIAHLAKSQRVSNKTGTRTHDKTLSSEPVTQNCIGRELNPGQLLGRQLCPPLHHRRF
jgi:hypothetical protein